MMQAAVVLLVEDEPLITNILQESLQESGFAVVAVSTGEAAITTVDECTALQALVADIRLGAGANGFEVAHYVRHRFPEAAVVYISGERAHEWLEKGVPRSVMIQKPFAPAQVVTAISILLNKTDLV